MRQTLTTKQQRFVDAFDGNATEAALAAGYSVKNHDSLRKQAHTLLHDPVISEAIKAREQVKMSATIANREERQKMWTDIMNDPKQSINARLKASELLGRSSGDFIERVALTTGKEFKAITIILATEDMNPANEIVEDAAEIANGVIILPTTTNGNRKAH